MPRYGLYGSPHGDGLGDCSRGSSSRYLTDQFSKGLYRSLLWSLVADFGRIGLLMLSQTENIPPCCGCNIMQSRPIELHGFLAPSRRVASPSPSYSAGGGARRASARRNRPPYVKQEPSLQERCRKNLTLRPWRFVVRRFVVQMSCRDGGSAFGRLERAPMGLSSDNESAFAFTFCRKKDGTVAAILSHPRAGGGWLSSYFDLILALQYTMLYKG